MSSVWRSCGVCKKEIFLNGIYQKCSISSCRKFVFCGVDCWDIHQSTLNHKSAWAEEERAPAVPTEERPRRRIVPSTGNKTINNDQALPQDILIVISKLKDYIKAKGGMNTSGDVGETLSGYVRLLVNQAIDNAQADGRKTVMGKDFQNLIL